MNQRAAVLSLTALLIGCGSPENAKNPEQQLRSALEVKIEERVINLGKDYDILVRGQKVATVSGKNVRIMSGDVFTLTTVDGKVLASEKEHKSFFALNRAASCYDSKGELTGYLGEERFKDFLFLSYTFHFYDADKKEIGTSKKLGKSALNSHNLYDGAGNVDYTIDKHFSLVGDSYTLKILDHESAIPLTSAIFMVCIEDAIGDAHD